MALAAALFVGIACTPARAQGEDTKREISILVGFGAGGSEDLRARALAAKLTDILQQPVIVVNRAGASGTIALAQLARARPDGLTLGSISASPMVFTPHLQKVDYRPDDFTYLAGAVVQPFCICVRQDARWQTLADLLEDAKRNPDKLSYGHPGVGHQSHVIVEIVNRARGVKMTGVPFKGDADSITALLGGHVDVASLASTFVPYAKAGRLRALAVISETRLRQFPDVPTLKELGFDIELRAPALLGYGAPKGLPADVRRRLEMAFAQAIQSPEFTQALDKLDNQVLYRSGEAFGRQVTELNDAVARMLKEIGL